MAVNVVQQRRGNVDVVDDVVDSGGGGGGGGGGVDLGPSRPASGVRFEMLAASLRPSFRRHFPTYVDGMCRSLPGHFLTTPEFARNAHLIYQAPVRADDVYVMTFPKSGTTWTQEMLWLIANDCNFEAASKKTLTLRSPYFEGALFLNERVTREFEKDAVIKGVRVPFASAVLETLEHYGIWNLIQPAVRRFIDLLVGKQVPTPSDVEHLRGPRIIKTHLTFNLLNPDVLEKSKVVYVARNPKDVIVSYYHYHRVMNFHSYQGDLDAFADYFLKDQVWCAPYFPHLLQAWKKRHHPNMLFLFYEDLKRDLRGEIEKVAAFLGKKLDDDQVAQLTQHLRFDAFSKNATVNLDWTKKLGIMKDDGHFIRKGKTGDWKNHFSPELNERIDKWMEAHLAGTDLRFVTELEEQD